VILLLWEPMNFASEALTVLPSITFRGVTPAMELLGHGLVAALAAAGGLALWHGAPSAARLGGAAVLASVARTIQSLYFSTLPHNVMPGDESSIAAAALVIAAIALIAIGRSERPSR
jgi:hypothetical protein